MRKNTIATMKIGYIDIQFVSIDFINQIGQICPFGPPKKTKL